MIKKIITMLNSPFGFKYKCIFIYNYKNINNINIPINGTFYIGNPKTTIEEACITISVFYPNNDSLVNSSIASLILVKYFESCSENKKLPSGEGTIDMINTSLSFVKQVCKFITEFKLNDASKRKCDNGSTITLPYFYITQYNKTWYEAKFNAYLKEPLYTNYKNDIMRIMNTQLPEFDIFVSNHIINLNINKNIINELKKIYNSNNILQDLFKDLYRIYGVSMSCIILQPWIDTFMNNVGLNKYITMYDWYISVNTIPNFSFKHTNIFNSSILNNTRKHYPWNNSKQYNKTIKQYNSLRAYKF